MSGSVEEPGAVYFPVVPKFCRGKNAVVEANCMNPARKCTFAAVAVARPSGANAADVVSDGIGIIRCAVHREIHAVRNARIGAAADDIQETPVPQVHGVARAIGFKMDYSRPCHGRIVFGRSMIYCKQVFFIHVSNSK